MTRSRTVELRSWPAGREPTGARVYAHNERVIAAPPEQVWDRLIEAERWPRWYRNAHNVVLPPGHGHLGPGLGFRWTTFGVRLSATVVDFRRRRRLGWTFAGRGVAGYHGWVIEPHPRGSRVVTEESQTGVVPALLAPALWLALKIGHAYWLRALARQARSPARTAARA